MQMHRKNIIIRNFIRRQISPLEYERLYFQYNYIVNLFDPVSNIFYNLTIAETQNPCSQYLSEMFSEII